VPDPWTAIRLFTNVSCFDGLRHSLLLGQTWKEDSVGSVDSALSELTTHTVFSPLHRSYWWKCHEHHWEVHHTALWQNKHRNQYEQGTSQIICKEKQRSADPTNKCSPGAARPTSSTPGWTCRWSGHGSYNNIAITDRLGLDQDQRRVWTSLDNATWSIQDLPGACLLQNARRAAWKSVSARRPDWNAYHVIVRPLSTVGYTSVASVIHCRQGLTNIIQDHSPEGSVTQLHECSVFWKTPLFSERKYTLLGSKLAEQGAGTTKAYRRKPTIEQHEWVYSTLTHSRLYCTDREKK